MRGGGKDVSKVRVGMISPLGECVGQREEVRQESEVSEW